MLENGYDTIIGEGSARLSTGERQLISFARALIADPQIFITDEAASASSLPTGFRLSGLQIKFYISKKGKS